MKMNKWFMLGMVGLAFTACSNEEELGNQLPNGNGAVTVKLVSPTLTKAIAQGTTGNSVKVTGTLTITLMDGTTPKETTVTVGADGTLSSPTVTFWNVTNPVSVSAKMNGGVSDYNTTNINVSTSEGGDMQAAPASIPVYGSATPSPMGVSKPGVDAATNTNVGAVKGDSQKQFDMYAATVNLEIPVARLEVSGITHVEHQSPVKCEFEDLKICGVYLDNIRLTDGGALTNYRFPGDNNAGSEAAAILSESINGGLTGGDAFVSGTTWPSANNAFAFNFYAPAENDQTITSVDQSVSKAQNPHFKVLFSCKDNSGVGNGVRYRYAMITSYKNQQGEYIVMRKGHIYKITAAAITDDGILPDEEGNTTYGVEVTVEEAVWGVETITGEWVEQ